MLSCAVSIVKSHLPESDQVEIVGQAVSVDPKIISLPLYLDRISAGFPSPADDYIEAELDLNRYMIRNPPDTFMVRVTNDALSGAGILDGDVLIVDRSIGPRHGMIVVAVVNGEMCVRRLNRKSGNWVLDPENRDFQPLRIRPGQDLEIWGVVTGMVRKY